MSEKIFIDIDNERVELTGQALEDFLADRAQLQAQANTQQAEADAKAAARESGLAKLLALGLTEDEVKGLVG